MTVTSTCAVALLTPTATACGTSSAVDPAAGPPRGSVLAAFSPYEFVAARVAGDAADVVDLTKPGAEPHDVELTARQVVAMQAADLVVHSSGFQPAVDGSVEGRGNAFDVTSVVELVPGDDARADEAGHDADEQHADHAQGPDPHVWLDPERLTAISAAVAERLAARLPEHADGFRSRQQELAEDLRALDGELGVGLADCDRRKIITSHDAFGYLAGRYRLEQVLVAGLSPDQEPSPRRLQEVAETARAAGATTVFFEENASGAVAETVAREIGADTGVLTPLENAPETGDHLSAMRADLEGLRTALGCR